MSDEEVYEELVYEYWDCPQCGNKGIRGDQRVCTQCGNPRDENITFYRKEEQEEVVEDQQQQAAFEAGPDWECQFCGSLNSSTLSSCKGCGNERSEGDKSYFEAQAEKQSREAEHETGTTEEEPAKGGGKIFAIILAAVLLIGGGLWWWLTRETDVDFKVTSVKWQRVIPHLRYKTSLKTDWDENVKGDDVQIISKNQKIKEYKQVVDRYRTETYQDTERYQSGTKKKCSTSYKSTGSGASKKTTTCKDVPVYSTRKVTKTREVPVYKKVPVYDTQVTYKSKSYDLLRNVTSTGTTNDVKWPALNLGTGEDGKKDKEGERSATYTVNLKKINSEADGPGTYRFNTTEQAFTSKYIAGKTVTLPVSTMGNINIEDEIEKSE